jgi:hypothetical protein
VAEKHSILTSLYLAAATALDLKARRSRRDIRRNTSRKVYAAQEQRLEGRLVEVLKPLFSMQIRETAERLLELAPEELEEKHLQGVHNQLTHGRGGGGGSVDGVVDELKQRFPQMAGFSVYVDADAEVVTPPGGVYSERFGYYDPATSKAVVAGGPIAKKQDQAASIGGELVDPSIQGAIRHEAGHHVYEKMGAVKRAEWEGLVGDVDLYEISGVAGQNMEEGFYESFSYFTAPDYDGDLPSGVSGFLGILEGQKKYYKTANPSNDASSLVALAFDSNDPRWRRELIDRVLPVMAVGILEAMTAQMLEVGVDPRRKGVKRRGGRWVGPESTPNYFRLRERIRAGKAKCYKCGSKSNLLVHHVDGDSSNDRMSNLRIVCDACHRAAPDGPWY